MAKKTCNDYAVRAPDSKLFQKQMKQRYIRNLGRKSGRKKNTFAVENETYETVRQDRNESASQPSDYAEEKITDSGTGLITYSRDKAVSARKKSVSKRVEKKRAEEVIRGACAEDDSIVNPQALGKDVDLVTQSVLDKSRSEADFIFRDNVERDKVVLI